MQGEPVTLHEIFAWLLLGMLCTTMLVVHLALIKLDPISLRISPSVQMQQANGNALVTVEVVIPRNADNITAKLEWADPDGIIAGSHLWTLNGEESAVVTRLQVRLDQVGQWEFAAVVWGRNGIRGRATGKALIADGSGH